MAKPTTHSFHTRLPQDLKAALDEARGSRSLNSEIVTRLRRSLEPDEASRIADALRPLLASLPAEDRADLAQLAVRAARLLDRHRPRRRRRDSAR